MSFSIEVLGLIAGLLILGSSFPQIQYNLGLSKEAATASKWRQMLIVLGNLLWVLYGALNHSVSIWLMCFINVILNLVIYFQIKK